MAEAVGSFAILVAGMALFTYREQIAGFIKRRNEAVYRRLPRVVGDPLLRRSATAHGWMAFMIAMGGLLWVIAGVGGLVYALMG